MFTSNNNVLYKCVDVYFEYLMQQVYIFLVFMSFLIFICLEWINITLALK